jgi:hypothetical protein
LSHEATRHSIERDLALLLKSELRVLGLAPLPKDGLLLKEVTPPEKFKQTMLEAKHDETILNVIRNHPVPELLQLLNQVLIANGLKEGQNQLVMVGNPETMQLLPLTNGQHRHTH